MAYSQHSILVPLVIACAAGLYVALKRPSAFSIAYTDVPLGPIISIKSNDVTFVLEVFRSRFMGNLREVFFGTSNCTGPAFLRDSEEPLPYATVISQTAYVGDTRAPIAFTFLGSTLNDDGSSLNIRLTIFGSIAQAGGVDEWSI